MRIFVIYISFLQFFVFIFSFIFFNVISCIIGKFMLNKLFCLLNSLLTLIPYNRIGQPEDIGKLAAWLACDESDYITGTTVFCDGGMTLYPGFSTNG